MIFSGYQRLIRRATLAASDYVKDDCFTMRCKVGVVRNCVEGFTTTSMPPCHMTQNLNYLLETETGCDVVLHVSEQTFKAHKSILAARSPVFRAQFFGDHPSLIGDQVVLKDVEPSIFKVITFIYFL